MSTKKFNEVDEQILSDLDNLIIYDSFYTSEEVFLKDIYQKIIKDKKILEDIYEKYSKKHKNNSLIMEDNKMINLKETISILTWAENFHKINDEKNEKDQISDYSQFKKLQENYYFIEKNYLKNKNASNKLNNNSNIDLKEKKEKIKGKKKTTKKESENNNYISNNDGNLIENNTEIIKEEQKNNLIFFNNEIILLNKYIEDYEKWKDIYKNKFDIINQCKQKALLYVVENPIDDYINIKNDEINNGNVSNNSTAKNTKKKFTGKSSKKNKIKAESENIEKDIPVKDNEINITNKDNEIIDKLFEINSNEKCSSDEIKEMLNSMSNLKIKEYSEKIFLEKCLEEYNKWLKDYNSCKEKIDAKLAKRFLSRAESSIIICENIIHLQDEYTNYLKLKENSNFLINNFSNILEEFFYDQETNKVNIYHLTKFESFINNEWTRDQFIFNANKEIEKKENLIKTSELDTNNFNNSVNNVNKNLETLASLSEIIKIINNLKEEIKNNSICKNTDLKPLVEGLNQLETNLNNYSFIFLKVFKEEEDLDFLKFFYSEAKKFSFILKGELESLSKKIIFMENYHEKTISNSNNYISIDYLKELENQMANMLFSSKLITEQIIHKKNLILEIQNELEKLITECFSFDKIPEKNLLIDFMNKINLNKIILENKYSLILNSWNNYYQWYENIIKLLIMLKIQHKKSNKNFFNEVNANELLKFNIEIAIENDMEYSGGKTILSELIENDIELISQLGIPRLKDLLNNLRLLINNDESLLIFKGNFLNMKKNLEFAITYNKISELVSLYNFYGYDKVMKNNENDLGIDGYDNNHNKPKKTLKDIFELYTSINFDECMHKNILRDKVHFLKSFISDLKKWLKDYLELYHTCYKKDRLENFFLAKNLITKLLPLKNQGIKPITFTAISNLNSEYSKINFEEIHEMNNFFDLISLISNLTDYSKSIADLINLERKLNAGNKRKFDSVFSDYSTLKNQVLEKLEKVNFENLAQALEAEYFVKSNIFENERIELNPNTLNTDNIIISYANKDLDDKTILFYRSIHNSNNVQCKNTLKYHLEIITDEIYFSKEFENEVSFNKKWLDRLNLYKTNKERKAYEEIDLCLIEIMITESQKSLFDLSAEVIYLKNDLEKNLEANNVLKKLINDSENFTVKLNQDNENILADLINNQINLSDLSVINRIKSLYWMQRAFNFLNNARQKKSEENNNTNYKDKLKINDYNINSMHIDKLNYKCAIKFSQEASSLVNFQEIKRKEFYISLTNQITAARNIRDVIELIKSSNSNNLKQPISEESFERIQKEIFMCLIDLPEELDLIEKIKKDKNNLMEKFNNFFNENQTIPTSERLFEELKSFGIIMPKLIIKLEKSINEANFLNKEIKKLLEMHKINKMVFYKENVDNILNKYESLKINFENAEALKAMMQSSQIKINKLKEKVLKNENFDLKLNFAFSESYLNNIDNMNIGINYNYEMDIYELNSLLNSIEIHETSVEKKIRKKIWLKKYELIFENNKYIPDFHFLKNLYSEINEISISELNCFDKVDHLMSTLEKVQDLLNKVLNCTSKTILETLKEDAKNFNIDLSEFFIQQEIKIECKGYGDLNNNKDLNPSFYKQVITNLKNNQFLNVNFDKFKNVKSNEKNQNINLNNSNNDSKRIGFIQNKNKQEHKGNITGLIEIENNPKAENIILNKSILNVNQLKNENNTFVDSSTAHVLNNSDNKSSSLLGNKRKQDDIVDLICNSKNEEFMNCPENSLSQTRSRRNISVKIDKDFFYDKEFIKNVENNIKAQKYSTKLIPELNSENNIIDKESLRQNITLNLLEECDVKSQDKSVKSDLINTNNFPNNNNLLLLNESFLNSAGGGDFTENEEKANSKDENSESNNKQSYNYIYDSDKIENKKIEVDDIKNMINLGLHNPPLLLRKFNRVIDPLKESIRKNSILQVQLVLKENLIFYNNFGVEKLDKIAEELELQVKKNHPKVNDGYNKAVDYLIKSLREIKKYENVSKLIVREKLGLNKVAFYPYGPKLIEKLKKIDKQSSNKNKLNVCNNDNNYSEGGFNKQIQNKKLENIKNILHSKKTGNINNPINKSDSKNYDYKKITNKQQSLDFLSMMNEMNEFYNSLSASDALKNKLDISKEDKIYSNKIKNRESQTTESIIRGNSSTSALDNSLSIPHEDLHFEDEDDSLKSECEMDLIKFSPPNKYEENKSQNELKLNENSALNKSFVENTDSHLDNSINIIEENSNQIYYSKNKLNNTSNNNSNLISNSIFNYTNESINNKYISPFEKIYNPYEIEEEEEEHRKTLDLKNKKRNVCLPIFYNPEFNQNKELIHIGNEINNNKISRPNINFNFTANYINGFLNSSEKNKKIYQIWNGNIISSKFNFPVKFLSSYPNEIFIQMLNLPDNFSLASKTITKEVVNYIEKNITKDEKLFLFSWVEIDDEKNIENYKKIADEYDKNDKTALIKNGEDKYYAFPLSNKYPKLYRKISSSFDYVNKDIMNKLDKIICICIAIKNPLVPIYGNTLNPILLKDKSDYENKNQVIETDNNSTIKENNIDNYTNFNYYEYEKENSYNDQMLNNSNFISENTHVQNSQNPMNQNYYQTFMNNENFSINQTNINLNNNDYNISFSNYNNNNNQKTETIYDSIAAASTDEKVHDFNNYEEQDKISSITDENEEDENYEMEQKKEDEDSKVIIENDSTDNKQVSEEANLELYLKNDDLTMLEDYVNRHFSNLSQEEMVDKLMSLDENFREKLLNLVIEYQQKTANEDINQQENNRNVNNYHDINKTTEEIITNQDETSMQQIEIRDNVFGIQINNDTNKYINNQISQNQIEMTNQNNPEMFSENMDYSNSQMHNQNKIIQNNNTNNNIPNSINNIQTINSHNQINPVIQNQQQMPQMFPNQNPMYFQQHPNQYFNNIQPNYPNMPYNMNNYPNTRIMGNIPGQMNYGHIPPNNFPGNNQSNYYNMNNYNMQIRNPMMNAPLHGNKKGMYFNNQNNYNRNMGGNNAYPNNINNHTRYSNYQNTSFNNNPSNNSINNNANNYENQNYNQNANEDTNMNNN